MAGAIGKRLQACGYAMFRWREQGKAAGHFKWLQQRIRKQLQVGAAQNAVLAHGQHLRQPAQDRAGSVALSQQSGSAPTNNAAERALRGFVIKLIKRKLSFFTRSGRGLRFLERIFSTVQTCAIQGRQPFGYL